MIYSDKKTIIQGENSNGLQSLLLTDRLFTGKYWDEFSITSMFKH